MNPNARSFAFNPAAQGFMPPQVAAQYQQQQQGAGNQQQGEQQNNESQQQAGAGGSSQQQPYYQQGGYAGYPQQGGYNAGGYGAQQGQAGGFYGGKQGGYYQQGGYAQQQYQQTSQQSQPAPVPRATGGLPPKPSAADPDRKPVVMSLGGGAPSTTNNDSVPKKPVSISIGGPKKDEAPKKPVNISIGGAAATAASTPAPAAGVAAIKKEATSGTQKTASPPGSRSESPTPVTGSTAGAAKDAKTPGSGQAAKKAAKVDQKVEKSETNAEKILQEASKATDEETMRDLFGDKVDDMKSHLNIVFVGHVDAGKSTMGGQLLHLTGMVDKRTLEKYEREAKDAGRETWYLSWALDSTPQEREKGKTVEVGRAYFETGKRRYTILDAPGHKTYVPSMISGAAQADVALLVISARKGEFETGFERGGQTREHAMLVKTAGVQRLIVVVNKMDDPTVQWDQSRFDEIVTKLTPFLKGSGFNPKTDITFIPVSAYAGQNLKDAVSKDICSWYSGPPLLQYLDDLNLGDRKISEPLKMPISEKYSDMGTVVVGKIEAGKVKKGDNLLLMPNKSNVEVMAIFNETEDEVPAAISGDNVRIKIKGVDHEDVSVGFVLTDSSKPVNTVRRFEAQLAILESRNIICAGYSAVMHVHTASEEITLQALLHYYDKKTGKKSRKPPQFAKKGMKIVALIETAAPICVERFADYPQLGRFTVRDEGRTIGIGKITKLSPNIEEMPDVQKMAIADSAAP
ncbi:uncharacterized protein FA14DRAFT_187640 [Meira miltonrushii]|uniref:Eukaryotic peptide chain release factor GTP-binding subunit n=1 Tax=Meira miltonrushii TaxID=1280837 RepID=A0A316VKH0_9BASI|nr:uncharacterized protein FA14DRAFT_187640 [Meira miltonrushii]PWN37548.1 hypothetical protein FA14DRAFT_187640 [Meira miltonrushii]